MTIEEFVEREIPVNEITDNLEKRGLIAIRGHRPIAPGPWNLVAADLERVLNVIVTSVSHVQLNQFKKADANEQGFVDAKSMQAHYKRVYGDVHRTDTFTVIRWEPPCEE